MFGSESAIDGASTVENGARTALVDMDGSKRANMIASKDDARMDDLRRVSVVAHFSKGLKLYVRRTRCDLS